MNKKFTAFFSSYGMNINGNYAYGAIKGYEANAAVVMLDNVAPLRMHISFYATDYQKEIISSAIRNLALKFFKMQFTPYGLSLGFNDITVNRLLKRLPATLDTIFGILSENGAKKSEFCPVCGQPLSEMNVKKCNIDGYTITLDNDCVKTINSVISAENQDFNNAPNNYFRGFLGALLGALVGVAISVVLYIVGFVSSISAIVAICLGSYLYQKFQGKPNKMMIVIVSLTTLVLLAASIPAIYIALVGFVTNGLELDVSALEAFQILLREQPEFARMFYADLVLVVVFSAIGTGFQIYALSKKIKRKNNI